MKINRIIPLALAFSFIFILYGMASGDGGGGVQNTPTQCRNLPDPTDPNSLSKINKLKGPFLYGLFMASLDRGGVYYNVHLLLQGETNLPKYFIPTKVTHLFEQEVGPIAPSSRNICEYTEAELMRLYRWIPCSLNIQEPFGLKGIPVLTELTICKKDFCEDRRKATIYGTVKIKVVPAESLK